MESSAEHKTRATYKTTAVCPVIKHYQHWHIFFDARSRPTEKGAKAITL